MLRVDGGYDQAEGLRRLLEGKQAQVVTVSAARSKMGRTSITLNLAAALVRSGRDVLVLDENYGEDNLLDSLGLLAEFDLLDIAHGVCQPEEACLHAQGFTVLSVSRALHALSISRETAGRSGGADVFSGPGLSWDEWQRMEAGLAAVTRGVDVVLIDGAMMAGQATVSSGLSDGASLLVTVEGTPAGITDSYALIKRMALEFSHMQFGIVVNRVANEKAAATVFENMAKLARRTLALKLEYLGHIPQDNKLGCATQMCRSVVDAFPASAASQAYLELAQNLMRMPIRSESTQGGVATIVRSLMNQASQPLRNVSKQVARVVH